MGFISGVILGFVLGIYCADRVRTWLREFSEEK